MQRLEDSYEEEERKEKKKKQRHKAQVLEVLKERRLARGPSVVLLSNDEAKFIVCILPHVCINVSAFMTPCEFYQPSEKQLLARSMFLNLYTVFGCQLKGKEVKVVTSSKQVALDQCKLIVKILSPFIIALSCKM